MRDLLQLDGGERDDQRQDARLDGMAVVLLLLGLVLAGLALVFQNALMGIELSWLALLMVAGLVLVKAAWPGYEARVAARVPVRGEEEFEQ